MEKNLKERDFERQLHSFVHEVGIICALEYGGKIPPEDAYKRIKALWKQLKGAKKVLKAKPSEVPDQFSGKYR